MSSPEGPAGPGSEQPAVPSAQPHSPAGSWGDGVAGQPNPGPQRYAGQPQPGQRQPYPGEPGYPGPYGGGAPSGYPAPGQPYASDPYAGQAYPTGPYGAQPYGGQPYGTPYPAGYGQVYPRNDLAVWSLVLGILGLAGATLLTGIPAIILGRRARQAVQRGEANNDGAAVAGLVTGWIATAIGALLVVGIAVAVVVAIATSTSSQPY